MESKGITLLCPWQQMRVHSTRHALAALLSSNRPGTYCRKLGGIQFWSGWGWERKNPFPPPEIEPLTIQPIASQYTNYNILVHIHYQ